MVILGFWVLLRATLQIGRGYVYGEP